VLVSVGEEANVLFVDVTNDCGSRKSNKLFLTSPRPEDPLLSISDSEYKGYKQLSISNASLFTAYQWYLNNEIISGSNATRSSYVAYLPGNYTVAVKNKEGCENIMEEEDGMRISQRNQIFSAYASSEGTIVVLNSTGSSATLRVFNFQGQLLKTDRIDPGYNEVGFPFKGAFILKISGEDTVRTLRLFHH
jgi:hypothetical protein